jgi:hypothetical protein
MLSPSPGAQRRRVDPLRLTTEESPLIQPSEVVVSQRPVLTAEPVLTPIGNMILGVVTLTSDTLFPKFVEPYGNNIYRAVIDYVHIQVVSSHICMVMALFFYIVHVILEKV